MLADAQALSRVLLGTSGHALITECGAEALAVASVFNGSTSCIGDAALREGFPRTVQFLPRLPSQRRFNLLVVTASWFRTHHHSASQLQMELGRLRRRMRTGARVLLACDSAVAAVGLGAVRRMGQMLTQGEEDDETTRLHLVFSLLQSLPGAHSLRRNVPLRSVADLSDVDELYARRLVPASNADAPPHHATEMLAHRFVRALCDAGFAVQQLFTRRGLPLELSLPSRLSLGPFHWVWRAQLYELLHADAPEHIALANVPDARHASPCTASLLASLESLESALDGVEPAIGAPLNHGEQRGHALGSLPPRAAATSAADAVSELYEDLPFPPRIAPIDEASPQPRHSSLTSLVEVSHFAFSGRFRARFCGAHRRPFRALIVGGGTGDSVVQMMHELRALHEREPSCRYDRSQVVQLELSAASTRAAAARLKVRRLRLAHGATAARIPPRADGANGASTTPEDAPNGPTAILVRASLLELPWLGLGRFDYVQAIGVLHHLPDPAAALALIARHALREDGCVGLMQYGLYGRAGVYETQAALRMIHAVSPNASMQRRSARAAAAFELLEAMPPWSPLRRNEAVFASHEARGRMGDAGVADLLLHPIDQPYTRRRLVTEARAAGLEAIGWLTPALYEPSYWLQRCTGAFAPCELAPPLPLLRVRMAALHGEARAEWSELLAGHVRKHWAYLANMGRTSTADVAATGSEEDLCPCFANMSDHTREVLAARTGRAFDVRTSLQGESLTMHLPALTSELLARIDCRTPLWRLWELVETSRGEHQGERATLRQQWKQLFTALADVGFLFMTDLYTRL